MYVAPEVDSDDENVEYEDESGHRYRLYLDELEEGANSSSRRKDPNADVKPSQGEPSKMYYMQFHYEISICKPISAKHCLLYIYCKINLLLINLLVGCQIF